MVIEVVVAYDITTLAISSATTAVSVDTLSTASHVHVIIYNNSNNMKSYATTL